METKTSNITLVLFTSLFPYEGGETFLETEMEYLSEAFKEVVIVPTKKNKSIRPLPANVKVDFTIANSKTRYFYKLKSLFGKYFIRNFSLNFNEIKYLFKNAVYVENHKEWIISLQKENVKNILFYSYWFEAPTAALALVKNKFPELKFITRVHGGDLYESLYGLTKFPFRQKIISSVNSIFAISELAKTHLMKKYYLPENKIFISRLGVKATDSLSPISTDGKVRIVSCSNLIPLKRIDLIIKALGKIKNVQVVWTHIGDGELKTSLIELAKKILGKNIDYRFTGLLKNSDVLNFYKTNPVDVFITTSSSEGIPVSIMEAQSFGIPVIATNVGGIKEIVSNENGLLLKDNPAIEEITDAILSVINNKKKWKQKRTESFDTWQTKFNAKNNYKEFINNLTEIL